MSLLEKAKELQLDEAAFQSCLVSGRYGKAVSEDMASGTRAGVNGLPAFFVNGVFLEGVQSIGNLQKTIDEELTRTSGEKK